MSDGYIICSTPRTGSTLLCSLLASTKRTGDPDSFFGGRFIAWWAGQWGLPDRESMGEKAFAAAYLEAAIRVGTAGTGMFGLRLMRESVDDLNTILNQVLPPLASDRERFEKAFGRLLYIHLSRGDKLAQAISLVKAEQTGLWHVAPDGTEIERIGPPGEPEYDFARIRREVEMLEGYDAAWHAWFEAQGIEPLRVDYDGLSADPAATLVRICEALSIPAPDAGSVKPSVARLSDATSADWARRYRADVVAA